MKRLVLTIVAVSSIPLYAQQVHNTLQNLKSELGEGIDTLIIYEFQNQFSGNDYFILAKKNEWSVSKAEFNYTENPLLPDYHFTFYKRTQDEIAAVAGLFKSLGLREIDLDSLNCNEKIVDGMNAVSIRSGKITKFDFELDTLNHAIYDQDLEKLQEFVYNKQREHYLIFKRQFLGLFE